ncbi:hypothetical protein B0H14DRAFT_3039904 [Mycena olivaceomarginata]|nr:hypothetical protein B0H14DRAFT_3039904 [Mycena olivaceomarginata]
MQTRTPSHRTTILVTQSTSYTESRKARPHNFEYTHLPLEVPASFSPSTMVMQTPDIDYPVSDDRKWATVVPPHLGFIRLGPDGTPFSIAMFHQLHCTPEALAKSFGHANHCFDILRHGVCSRVGTGNGTEVVRQCAVDHAEAKAYKDETTTYVDSG